MEEICRNCIHFEQRNLDAGRYLSACRKDTKEEIIFKWANETCLDFAPRWQNEKAE